jgi:hypothetical protein
MPEELLVDFTLASFAKKRIPVNWTHNGAASSVCSLSRPKSDISDYGHFAISFTHSSTCVLQRKPKKARISLHRPAQL